MLEAIGEEADAGDEFALCDALNAKTGYAIPASIVELKGLAPRFTDICEKQDMWQAVTAMLGLN